MIIESPISIQHSEIIEIFEPNEFKLRQLRPIVRKLSQLFDILLKLSLKYTKSFIHDRLNFLIKFLGDLDGNTEIVTFDVITLSTGIPHEFCLDALDYVVTKYQQDLLPKFKQDILLELAKFILKSNTLTFGWEFYLQIKRTVMCTIFASTYASLTMGSHEIKVYSIIRQSYTLTGKHFEHSCLRFLHGCQILLKANLIKPDYLLSILNQIINNIQFTIKESRSILIFLDIMINKSDTKIWMDIYNKSTDCKQYVTFTLNHPRHCLTNIPVSLAGKNCAIV